MQTPETNEQPLGFPHVAAIVDVTQARAYDLVMVRSGGVSHIRLRIERRVGPDDFWEWLNNGGQALPDPVP